MKVKVVKAIWGNLEQRTLRVGEILDFDEARFGAAPEGFLEAVEEEKPKKARTTKKAKPSE